MTQKTKKVTLDDVMPKEYRHPFKWSKAQKRMGNVPVVKKCSELTAWIGPGTKVYDWWILENGYAVGAQLNDYKDTTFHTVKISKEVIKKGSLKNTTHLKRMIKNRTEEILESILQFGIQDDSERKKVIKRKRIAITKRVTEALEEQIEECLKIVKKLV